MATPDRTSNSDDVDRRTASSAAPELVELDSRGEASSDDVSTAGTVEGRVTGFDAPSHSNGAANALAPIAGAKLEFFLRRGGELARLGETEADRDGRFLRVLLKLAAVNDYERNFCELVAIAHAVGRASATETRQLRFDRGDVRGLDFVLDAALEVRGRTIDGHANPIAGAVLRELHANEPLAVTDADGRFAFGFSPQSYPRLEITALDGGSARIDVAANGATEVDLGDVVLGVGPHLRGVIRHADGTPARGVELFALRVPTDGEAASEKSEAVRDRIDFYDDDSAYRSVSDARGRFAIFPRSPGEFLVGTEREVAGDRYRTDRDDLELVAGGNWLVVHVVDDRGRAMSGAEVEFALLDAHGAATNAAHVAATGDDAVAEYWVQPNSKYRASIAADGTLPCETVLEVGAQPGCVRATLTVVAYEKPARLHVSIAHPRDVAVHGFRAELRTLDSRTPVATFFGFECDEHGASPPLAPGSFELELAPYGDSNVTAYLRRVGSRPTVVLESGKTRDVEVEFALGGRIALHVSTPSDRALAPSDLEQATISLTDLSGAACDAHWTIDGERVRSAGAALLAGSADSAEVFEPGRYRLRVEAPHFAPASVEFALFEGETANVECALETRD